MRLFIALFALLSLLHSEKVEIDIAQINKFFDKDRDGVADRVAFDLAKFEEFYQQLGTPQRFDKITQKYLSLTYPQGKVRLNDILHSSLPPSSQKLIVQANNKSLILSTALSDLWSLDAKALEMVKAKSVKVGSLEANEIETKAQKYQDNMHYVAYIRIGDTNDNEYLSSNPSNEHLVSEVLSKIKGSFDIEFVAGSCTQDKCKSKGEGIIFSSFSLQQKDIVRIATGDRVVANCSYDTIYRREYSTHKEIEITYRGCRLLTINGKTPPKFDSVFERSLTLEAKSLLSPKGTKVALSKS